MNITLPIEAKDIQKLIPHRYPFLLLDRITAFESMKRLTAIKNVSMNEPHFQGHFPDFPVMPGVLIIEALAQACGTLAILSEGGRNPEEIYFFAGIDNARFKRPVMPGDQLHLHVEVIRQIRGIWKYKVEARVDGEVAAQAELMCAQRDVD